jgi:hypothetical protein
MSFTQQPVVPKSCLGQANARSIAITFDYMFVGATDPVDEGARK